MTSHLSQAVLDIVPWPDGMGFISATVWWEYVRGQTEPDRLELLMTIALLSNEVCQLLLDHDQQLLNAFALADHTIALIRSIDAATLEEFAQKIVLQSASTV